ncbi:MAG: hypothetical protein RLZ77_980, partial [Bacteroidota bacterium]
MGNKPGNEKVFTTKSGIKWITTITPIHLCVKFVGFQKQKCQANACIMAIKKIFFTVMAFVYLWNANAQNNANFVNTFIGTNGTG